MGKPLTALIVEDSEQDAVLVMRELTRGGYDVTYERVETREAMAAALGRQSWDIVLSDYSLPRFNAPMALGLVHERNLDLPFIIISGAVSEEIAVKALHAGARDFMAKGKLERLVPAIERELRAVTLRAAQKAVEEQLHQSQKLDSIGRLAGGIAHDFNNLLTVILGQLELGVRLTKQGRDPLPSIDQAMQAGYSAAALTRQLLMFASRQANRPEVLQLDSVVGQVQRMLARLIGEDITLQILLAPELANVSMDRSQLEQVILNLALNARDAMPHGGTLTIRTANITLPQRDSESGEPTRAFVQLSVVDTGTGMSEEVLQRIFEPFFTTKGPGAGTGIGLATVHRIVVHAGGFIEAHSKVGQGSTFDVYLPSTDAKPQPQRTRGSELPSGHESVVLVEDQPGVRALAEQQLNLLGYRVSTWPSAEEALVGLSPELRDVDLLITDVVLPGISGPSLVSQLRGRRNDLPFLYMSGYTDDAVLDRGIGTMAHLLRKPFSLQELALAVRFAIDEPSLSVPEPVSVG